MQTDIASTQLDLVGPDVVVLTIICAGPASAHNVFDAAKDELIAGTFAFGGYRIKSPIVVEDTATPAGPPSLTAPRPIDDDEDVMVVCWPETGEVEILRDCPEGAVGLAVGPAARLRHALRPITDERHDDARRYLVGLPTADPVRDAREIEHFSTKIRACLRPAFV